MPTTTQEEQWKAIQRDAKTAKLSPGEYLKRNPSRYEDYVQGGAKTSPLTNNPANRVISEQAQADAKAQGISEAAALVDLFGRDAEGRERYDQWRSERDKRLNPKVHGGGTGGATGPLSPAEMVTLQAMARELGTDLTLDELAGAGWVNARQLMADIADGTLASDTDDDGAESYGEIVRFTD